MIPLTVFFTITCLLLFSQAQIRLDISCLSNQVLGGWGLWVTALSYRMGLDPNLMAWLFVVIVGVGMYLKINDIHLFFLVQRDHKYYS